MGKGKSLICPYCFSEMQLHEIEFRCTNENDCSRQDDPILAKFYRVTKSTPMGKTFRPGGPKKYRKVLEQATCPDCKTPTGVKVCPKCHNELPRTFGQCKSLVLSVVGVKESGKSHLISVLIDKLINEIGPKLNCDVQALNDATIDRYRKNYYDPVFKRRETIHATRSAESDVLVKLPLIYTLTFLRPTTFLNRLPVLKLIFGTEPKPRKVVTLAFYDAAGEDLNRQSVMQREYKFIINSSGIILLVDPLQFPKVRKEFGESELPNENTNIMDLVSRLTNTIRDTNRISHRRKIGIPIAVTLSKSDMIAPLLPQSSILLHDPSNTNVGPDVNVKRTISQEVSGLLEDWTSKAINVHFAANYKNYSYFACSAIGTNAHGRSNIADIRPYRVEEPLLWLLTQSGVISEKQLYPKSSRIIGKLGIRTNKVTQ